MKAAGYRSERPYRSPVHGVPAVRWSSLAPRASANDLRGTRIALDAIADLPDRQRVAFYLRKIEGWTLEEIGEYLDCAASTAGYTSTGATSGSGNFSQ